MASLEMFSFSYVFIHYHNVLYSLESWISGACPDCLAQVQYVQALKQGLENIFVF